MWHCRNLRRLEQLPENPLLQRLRPVKQPCHVLQHEHPFVHDRPQLLFLPVERPDLDEHEMEVVRHQFARFPLPQIIAVDQFGIPAIFRRRPTRTVVLQCEIQYPDHVDRRQPEIPVAPEALFLDRERGIVQTPLHEIPLVLLLNLDNESVACHSPADDVEHGFPVGLGETLILVVEVCNILNPFVGEQVPEKFEEDFLVCFRTEKFLETPVRQRVNELRFLPSDDNAAILLPIFIHRQK